MKRKIIKGILVLVMVLVCTVLQSNIAFSNQSETKGEIEINYILGGVKFEARKVAEIAEDGSYVLCDQYKDCQVSLESDGNSDRAEQAKLLYEFAMSNQLEGSCAVVTNEYGSTEFVNLEKGMYLISGQSIDSEGYTYKPLPVLISIPEYMEDDTEVYTIIIEPKYNMDEIVIPEETTEPETSVTPETPEPNIPHTGQKVEHIIICGILSVVFYGAALLFRKKKKFMYATSVIGSVILLLGIFFVAGNVNKNIQVQAKSKEIVSEVRDSIVSKIERDEIVSEEATEKEEIGSIDIETVVTVEDNEYVGILSIPKLGKELPVMSELTMENLDIAPCLYYSNNGGIIIGAHNYECLFGRIINLSAGDTIEFTDANNNAVKYEVSGIEIINPYERDILISGEWDMTLFTCTYMGKQRIVVRCNEI